MSSSRFTDIEVNVGGTRNLSIDMNPRLSCMSVHAPSPTVFGDTFIKILASDTVQNHLTKLSMVVPCVPHIPPLVELPLLPSLNTVVFRLEGESLALRYQKALADPIRFLLKFRRQIPSADSPNPPVAENIFLCLSKPIVVAPGLSVTLWANQLIRLRLDIRCSPTNRQSFDEIASLLSQCSELSDLVMIVDNGALTFTDKSKTVYLPGLKTVNLIAETTRTMDNLLSRLRVHTIIHLFLQFKEITRNPWSPRPGQLVKPSSGGKIKGMSFGNISSILCNDDLLETFRGLEETHILNCSLPEWLFVSDEPPILNLSRVELGHYRPFPEREVHFILSSLERRLKTNISTRLSLAIDTEFHIDLSSPSIATRYRALLVTLQKQLGISNVKLLPIAETEVKPPKFKKLTEAKKGEIFDVELMNWYQGMMVRPC